MRFIPEGAGNTITINQNNSGNSIQSNWDQDFVDPIEIANTGPVRPNANPYFLDYYEYPCFIK